MFPNAKSSKLDIKLPGVGVASRIEELITVGGGRQPLSFEFFSL